MGNKILRWNFVSGKSGSDPESPEGRQLGFFRAAAWAATFRLGILNLYLRRNKELEKGSFSIILTTTKMKFLAFSPFHSFFLVGFVHGLLGDCWWKERKSRRCIGVPDRTKEEGPESDSSDYLVEPF